MRARGRSRRRLAQSRAGSRRAATRHRSRWEPGADRGNADRAPAPILLPTTANTACRCSPFPRAGDTPAPRSSTASSLGAAVAPGRALPAVPMRRGQNGGCLSPRLRHKGRMILCLFFSVKRNSKLFRALLHFLFFVAAAAPAFAQVYKWVDERGVTHYGERPPQGSKASEVPNRLASPAPSGTGAEANNPKDPSPEQGQARPQDQ